MKIQHQVKVKEPGEGRKAEGDVSRHTAKAKVVDITVDEAKEGAVVDEEKDAV